MFFDKFKELCDTKGVSAKRAVMEMGLSNSLATKWKNTGATPNSKTLKKVADYIGDHVSFLLSSEENTNHIIDSVSKFQAIISWVLDQDEIPDYIKDFIRSELPDDAMGALAALSAQAGCMLEKEKVPAAPSGDELLDAELIHRLCTLTPEELQIVDAFVQGLLAKR